VNTFSAQFASTRGTAVQRDVLPQQTPAPTLKTKAGRQSSVALPVTSPRNRAARVESIHEDDVDDSASMIPIHDHAGFDADEIIVAQPRASDRGYSLTDLHSDFSYVAPRTSHITIAESVNPPATEEEIEAAKPWTAQIYLETIPRWWREVPSYVKRLLALFALSPLIFLLGTVLWSQIPPEIGISSFITQLSDSIASKANAARNATLHKTTHDVVLYARVEGLEKQISSLGLRLNELGDSLPNEMIVTKDPTSGRLVIPSSFWHAIQDRLKADPEFNIGHPSAATPAWDAFIASNRAKIDKMISTSASNAAKSHIDQLQSSGIIITKSMFLSAVEEQTNSILAQLRPELNSIKTRAEHSARAIASSVASDLLSRRPSGDNVQYSEDITLLNIARTYLLRQERNYLSYSLFAIIDVHLTSPTYVPEFLSKHTLFSYLPFFPPHAERKPPSPNPPITALMPWSEAGQCWCAAASDEPGRAQLGILLERDVYASTFVIENVSPQHTYDIASSPRTVEVWGLLSSSSRDVYLQQPHPEDADEENTCVTPPPESGVGKVWICLGKGGYDIHEAARGMEVQSFELQDRNLSVRQIVVRVLENWGGVRTCIYRVRLLGREDPET